MNITTIAWIYEPWTEDAPEGEGRRLIAGGRDIKKMVRGFL
jgi:hypothetical protein